jgi:16S rRNA (cytidine1402-2'-O)-methyltransferase
MQSKTVQYLWLVPVPLHPESGTNSLPADAIQRLADARQVICEDIRTARRMMRKCGYTGNFEDINFFPIGKNNSLNELEQFLMAAGGQIALISESGMPCIADPGAAVVAVAHQMGIRVKAIPGPSSILQTLAASGFNGQQFCFNGYLPVKSNERSKKLEQLSRTCAERDVTQLFIETPFRADAVLEDILRHANPSIGLCLGINLGMPDEKIISMPIRDWKNAGIKTGKSYVTFALGKYQ